MRRVLTICGWSPAVVALLGGRVLTCGCLAGLYRMSDGTTVWIVDYSSRSCCLTHHREDAILPRQDVGSVLTERCF